MTADPPIVDVLDRAFWQRNPHDAWTWCRANDPVHRDERSGIWCITKHADVQWVERHAELFSSDSAYRLNVSPGESNMIVSDDPVHLHQRRLVNRRFTPRAVKAHVGERGAHPRSTSAALRVGCRRRRGPD